MKHNISDRNSQMMNHISVQRIIGRKQFVCFRENIGVELQDDLFWYSCDVPFPLEPTPIKKIDGNSIEVLDFNLSDTRSRRRIAITIVEGKCQVSLSELLDTRDLMLDRSFIFFPQDSCCNDIVVDFASKLNQVLELKAEMIKRRVTLTVEQSLTKRQGDLKYLFMKENRKYFSDDVSMMNVDILWQRYRI